MKKTMVVARMALLILFSSALVFTQTSLSAESLEKASPDEQLYDFKLGVHRIGEKKNVVEFSFPGENVDLYLFSMSVWEGLSGNKVQLVVNLYDKDKKLIISKRSVGERAAGDAGGFGSIALGVSKDKIENVKYFSIVFKERQKEPASIDEEGYTPLQGGQLEKIYQDYTKAMDEKNIEEVKKYMSEKNIERMKKMTEESQGTEMFFEFASMTMPRDLSNIQEGVKGDEAILSADSADGGMFGGSGKTKIRILFKKENGEWKIDKQEIKAVFGSGSSKKAE